MSVEPTVMIDAGTAFSVAGLLYLVSAGASAIHVLLNKQNVSSAFSWIGLIVLSPIFGALLYWLFGINRIRRRAKAEMRGRIESDETVHGHHSVNDNATFQSMTESQKQLFQTGLSIHDSRYLDGNQIEVLTDGIEAFPAMLGAIRHARNSIVLSSYIFEYDQIGKQFVEALIDAHNRGVSVYVSIDGVGVVVYGISFTKSDRVLRKSKVPTARFLPTFSPAGTRFINLRNHRKILSVDGEQAFIGGMNIRAGNLLDGKSKHQTQDIHFSVRGPVIDQINRVFEDDWQFATGQNISIPRWDGTVVGDVTCRMLLDGPDDNYEKLEFSIIAAINAARKSIKISTPYFLPDVPVMHALQLAVWRGVDVRLLIPEKNNLVFVDWAMRANESKLLKAGIKIFRSQPPFDHSKLFVIDSCWSLVGSSNWDARSFKLNFEINAECFDEAFAKKLEVVLQQKFNNATMVKLVNRPLVIRLRNSFFRLFTPYL